jgi:hypothetical protein
MTMPLWWYRWWHPTRVELGHVSIDGDWVHYTRNVTPAGTEHVCVPDRADCATTVATAWDTSTRGGRVRPRLPVEIAR